MIPTPESQHPSFADPPSAGFRLPGNWLEALMSLIESRFALIQLEARQSARSNASRAIRIIAAAFCLVFTWALLLIGGISAIAESSDWAWHWVALIAAAAHLLAAVLLVISCKAASPAFPVTRAEFQKDREWIENFQKKSESGN
jgi:hypothetical protein